MRVFRTTVLAVALAAVLAASADAVGTGEVLQLGSPYRLQLPGQSGCSPYQYELQSGEFPPAIFMTSDGLISGTPQLGGTYEPLIAIKSQCGSSESLLSYYVVDPAPLRIRLGGFYSAVKGSSYSYRLLSTEGGVMTWTLDSGRLPAGLRLRSDGWILGRPTVTGSFLFRVKADDGRRTATETFPLDVVARLAFTTRTKLPSASVGRHYRVRLHAHGGVAPYRWQIVQGSPPRGVRFAYGVFAGTPRVAGTFRITVRVWPSQTPPSTRTFTLTVRR